MVAAVQPTHRPPVRQRAAGRAGRSAQRSWIDPLALDERRVEYVEITIRSENDGAGRGGGRGDPEVVLLSHAGSGTRKLRIEFRVRLQHWISADVHHDELCDELFEGHHPAATPCVAPGERQKLADSDHGDQRGKTARTQRVCRFQPLCRVAATGQEDENVGIEKKG